MEVVIYAVGKRTGQIDADGRDSLIVYDVKLTRAAAEQVCKNNPGTEVFKWHADKS